ncbi:ABC transporter substrate-binding protein [Streptomyces sp. NRRL F-5126]|uniref:ABC transporter substrate-binding protein n=1 Tax=Streptomyces sp. NRRL F-5126 TaxID=1463857 RepID=UPI00099B6462|nr:ABC transporter substrate-binding protein [Streptomyces sp. NRRL F-5126]
MTHHDPHRTRDGRARRPLAHGGHRLLALATVTALGSVLLSACGDDSSASSSASGGGTTTVTVGISGNIFDMSIRVADAKGYFRKAGLKVKYVTLTAATGASALQSGSVQFLNDSPTNFLSAVGKGLPELAIGENGGGNPLGLIVSTKFAKAHGLTAGTPASQVAKALKGSTGGASSANTKAEAEIFLDQYHAKPGKWVSLPSPAADKTSLKSNQIDWFVTSEPVPLEVQNSGDGVVVADPVKVPAWSAKEAGYGQFVVTTKDYAAKNPAVTKKFATAVQQATNYMRGHLDDASVQQVASQALAGVPAPVIKASLPQVDWPKSDEMDTAGWNKTLAFVDKLGALSGKARVSSDDWTNTYLPGGSA